MLEDLDWSYLKEIFVKVECWSESLKPSRATWLEVSGIPLHCWNNTTLKRVAELWGSFEAFGENLHHRHDCVKVTILISTKQFKRIDEVVELEVGNLLYEIRVVEQGFKDSTSDPLMAKKHEMQESESVSESKSGQEKKENVEDDRSCSDAEVEAFNVMCAEKDLNKCMNREKENVGGQINEEELMGGFSNVEILTDNCGNREEESNQKVIDVGHVENVADFNFEGSQRDVSDEIVEKLDARAGEIEIGPFGVSSQLSDPVAKNMDKNECIVGEMDKAQDLKSWANLLDESLNSGKGFVFSDRGEALSEGENEKDFFEDLESRKGRRRGKKDIKFCSLLELKNRSISISERRKRDKMLRSRKLSKQLMEETELSGKSLSDSDIKSRCSILIKEAREVLKLGKKIGVEIVGDENEVVQDLSLEINRERPWGVPKLLAEIDSFVHGGGCQAWFQPGLERSWNAILQFASYRIEEKEFDNLSSECKLIQFRFIARAENKMAASLAIDGFSGLF
ncbi:hypothetical protein V6N13_027231 [Hibiscus sabdariffa]